MVEFLVRLSLHQFKDLPVPSKYVDQAKEISDISRRLLNVDAYVEDTAEATLRIYAVISSITNEEIEEDDWENMDTDEEDSLENYEDSDQMTQLMLDIAQGMQIGAEGESQGQGPRALEVSALRQELSALREGCGRKCWPPSCHTQGTRAR